MGSPILILHKERTKAIVAAYSLVQDFGHWEEESELNRHLQQLKVLLGKAFSTQYETESYPVARYYTEQCFRTLRHLQQNKVKLEEVDKALRDWVRLICTKVEAKEDGASAPMKPMYLYTRKERYPKPHSERMGKVLIAYDAILQTLGNYDLKKVYSHLVVAEKVLKEAFLIIHKPHEESTPIARHYAEQCLQMIKDIGQHNIHFYNVESALIQLIELCKNRLEHGDKVTNTPLQTLIIDSK